MYVYGSTQNSNKIQEKRKRSKTKRTLLCMSKRRKAMRGQTSEFSTYKITGYGVDHRGILLIIMWKCCETHQMPIICILLKYCIFGQHTKNKKIKIKDKKCYV